MPRAFGSSRVAKRTARSSARVGAPLTGVRRQARGAAMGPRSTGIRQPRIARPRPAPMMRGGRGALRRRPPGKSNPALGAESRGAARGITRFKKGLAFGAVGGLAIGAARSNTGRATSKSNYAQSRGIYGY